MNEKIIWDYFKGKGFTDAGTAGLMGNLYAESGLNPKNLQNNFEKKLGFNDDTYTKAVDNGSYNNFIKDSAGYGLAQWTYWSRKQNLYDYARSMNKSIGDLQMQLDFLYSELSSGEYKSLLNCLKSTNSILEASNGVLLQFERPADQSIAVQNKRASFGQTFYDEFKSKPVNVSGGKMKYSTSNKPLQCMMTNSTCYKGTRTMAVKGILWHSTGANNPNLKRYVQPSSNDTNYSKLINLLGKNTNGTDWNHVKIQAGLNAWIGKLADGTITTVQTMPWDYRPWGCGSGLKGSCNNGWIQFEICEDGLNDKAYFDKVYKEACELTAYLCKMYNLDPMGEAMCGNVSTPVILCHADSYRLGLGSNHGDVLHWFPKYGKTMADVRKDVKALMNGTSENNSNSNNNYNTNNGNSQIEEDEDMTQEKFNEMMNAWIAEQAKKSPGDWSNDARVWAEKNGFINGDANGNKMYKKFLTREEFAAVLYRALHRNIID